jgi:hypothetical protein
LKERVAAALASATRQQSTRQGNNKRGEAD